MMPFTEENGYELAPSYANRSYGGIFWRRDVRCLPPCILAVLRAELEVTERHNHSMIVGYVKPSMDSGNRREIEGFSVADIIWTRLFILKGMLPAGWDLLFMEKNIDRRTAALLMRVKLWKP